MTDAMTEQLGKKVGPMSLGVWLVAGGAGVAIAWYMRRHAAPAAPSTPDTSTWNQGGNLSTDPGIGNAAGGTNVAPLPSAPANNDEWFRRASDLLIARGSSGSQVQYSLGLFMSGQQLGPQDRAIVDLAILLVGNPPTPPPPAPNKPPSPPTVPPRHIPPMPGTPGKGVKPPYWGHTRVAGETLARVAIFYNTSSRSPGLTVQDLWNANKRGIRRLDGSPGVLTSYEVPHSAMLIVPSDRRHLHL